MESDLEMFNHSHVREMNREELLSFLYEYIYTWEYMKKYRQTINERLKKNGSLRSNELAKLDRAYENFCDENLHFHVRQARAKLLREKVSSNKKSNKKRTLKSLPLYIKILLGLILLLIGGEFIAMFIGIIISVTIMMIVFFFIPILNLITMAVLGVLAALANVLYEVGSKVLYSIFGAVRTIIVRIYNIRVRTYNKSLLKKAHQKDYEVSLETGITPENVREVFKYDKFKNKIDYKYNELEEKIRAWNYDEKNELQTKHHFLAEKIPSDSRNLPYVIYMYNQVEIGASDTWKEAINDLKLQIRHDELRSDLSAISNHILQTNESIIQMGQDISKRFSDLDQMIAYEVDRIDSRIDGMGDIIESSFYY